MYFKVKYYNNEGFHGLIIICFNIIQSISLVKLFILLKEQRYKKLFYQVEITNNQLFLLKKTFTFIVSSGSLSIVSSGSINSHDTDNNNSNNKQKSVFTELPCTSNHSKLYICKVI